MIKATWDDDYYPWPGPKLSPLLRRRHEISMLRAAKDIDDQAYLTSSVTDLVRFLYEEGIKKIDRELEALGHTGAEIDVLQFQYAEKCFREEDDEERDYWAEHGENGY
jgi:hypothetical protein